MKLEAEPMRVLVTGASGFLGSHVADRLTELGHTVRALVRATSRTEHLLSIGAEIAIASLESGAGLDDALDGVDAIVHSAGVVKARTPEDFHTVNVGGTVHLLDAAERSATRIKRFVFVSSLAAHGFSDDGKPRAVDAPARPVTHYGRSKMAAEEKVRERADKLDITVIRPPAIYGPRDGEMFNFFKMVKAGLRGYMGSPDNTLSLIYGPDCAEAICAALSLPHPSGSVFFVEDGRVYTQREFGKIVADALGVSGIDVSVPMPVLRAAAVGSELWGKLSGKAVMLTRDKVNELREPYLICASQEIRDTLGWTPEVQLEEGARRCVTWYQKEGWL